MNLPITRLDFEAHTYSLFQGPDRYARVTDALEHHSANSEAVQEFWEIPDSVMEEQALFEAVRVIRRTPIKKLVSMFL